LSFLINPNPAATSRLFSVKNSWQMEEWYHIAVTWNETTQEIYVNGVLDNSTTKTCSGGWGENLTVGSHIINDPSRFFKGDIDEVAIHNITLHPVEIKKHSTRYHTTGRILSKTITLPNGAEWESIYLKKSEGDNSFINISVIDVAKNKAVQGYVNRSNSTLRMPVFPANSIRLEAWFSGSGENTAVLESWGLEWRIINNLRDNFLGDSKCTLEGDYRLKHSIVRLAPNEYVPDNDTLALWHFDEGIGLCLGDDSGKENNGSIMGVNWTEGAMDFALEFDGINDFVNIPHSPSLNIQGNLSMSVWVNTSGNGNRQQIIVDKRTGPGYGFFLALGSNGKPFFQLGDGTNQCTVVGGADLRDGIWHNIAITWNSQGGVLDLYIDGNHVDTSTNSDISNIDTDNPLIIGACSYTESDYLKGFLDEIVILDRNLSSQEILAISNRVCINASLRSEIITTPLSHMLKRFSFTRYVPENCYLNISICDAKTDVPLLKDNTRESVRDMNVDRIDPYYHPSTYLLAEFQSDGKGIPVLDLWGIKWVNEIFPHIPKRIGNISDISFQEDTSAEISLEGIFEDVNIPPSPLRYSANNLEDDPRISMEVNGSSILFRSNTPNWTGVERFRILCINEMDLERESNEFTVNVTPVDDRPMWRRPIPDFTIPEDVNSTPLDLGEYVVDAEKDDLTFENFTSDKNITLEIEEESLTIYPAANWSGNASVNMAVVQNDNASLFSTTSFNITVIPVNDPPSTNLIFPVNGSDSVNSETRLTWSVEDNDGPGNFTYQVFLSNFLSEVKDRTDSARYDTNVSFLNLELDRGVYYWSVIAHDGLEHGECKDDYYRFTIDTDSSVPEVDLSFPIDGSIVNSANITLKWHCPIEHKRVDYELHFGNSSDWTVMQVINVPGTGSNDEEFLVTNLTDGLTYYWFVVAKVGNSEGRCISGIWNFTVDVSYIRITDINITTNITEFILNPGKNYNFPFTLLNRGNEDYNISLNLDQGIFLGGLDLSQYTFFLPPKGNDSFQLEISVSEDINIGNYTIKIVATIDLIDSKIYETKYPLILHIVEEKEEPTEEKPPGNATFMEELGQWFREYWELSIALLSGIAFLFGYLKLRKKKNKFMQLRRQIDNIYKNLSDRPEEAIISLESLSSHLTHFMDKEQITDNQYMILERKINDYILDFRGSARMINLRKTVKDMPASVRQKVVEILEDGRVSREEFDSFEGLLGNENISDDDREILAKFVGQWLKEDTGEVVDMEGSEDSDDSFGEKKEEAEELEEAAVENRTGGEAHKDLIETEADEQH